MAPGMWNHRRIEPMADRFVLAAIVDRLIYASDTTFGADDARTLLDALPRKPSPWIQFGVAGKMSGGSSRGFAAGVGDVQIKDDKDRQFQDQYRQRRLYPGGPVETAMDRQANPPIR